MSHGEQCSWHNWSQPGQHICWNMVQQQQTQSSRAMQHMGSWEYFASKDLLIKQY